MKKRIAFLIMMMVAPCSQGYITQGGPEFTYGMHKGYVGDANDCASVYSSGTSAFTCNLGYSWGLSNRPVQASDARYAVAPSRASPPVFSPGMYGYGRQIVTSVPSQLGPTGFAY